MKIIYLFFLTLMCTQISCAQEPKVTSFINLSGTIGQYPIEMQLNLVNESDTISGSYYYLKSGSENQIFVTGTFKNGDLILNERSLNQKTRDYESTGFFKLSSVKNTTVTGTWEKHKKEVNSKAALQVKLTSREALNIFDPYKFKYTIEKKKADYENITAVAARYFNIISLKIKSDNRLHSEISGFDEYDLVNEKPEVELQDLNFDGYQDLKIPIYYPDMSKGDYSYHYYLYDPRSKNFQRHEQLDDLGVLFFDARVKKILHYDADGRGNESTDTYQWQNGKLYLVKKIQTYEDDDSANYTEYQIINGKSVQTKSYKRK